MFFYFLFQRFEGQEDSMLVPRTEDWSSRQARHVSPPQGLCRSPCRTGASMNITSLKPEHPYLVNYTQPLTYNLFVPMKTDEYIGNQNTGLPDTRIILITCFYYSGIQIVMNWSNRTRIQNDDLNIGPFLDWYSDTILILDCSVKRWLWTI